MSARRYFLHSKKILITGAAGDIGAMTARALVAKGAVLYLTDINYKAVEEVALSCMKIAKESGYPVRVYYSRCDVTDDNSVKYMVSRAVGSMGGLDIAFVNAGVAKPVAMEGDVHVADWIFDINYKGARSTIEACLPHIRASKGYILANASMGAIVLLALMAQGYGVSKSSLATCAQGTNLHLIGTGARCATLFMAEHDTRMEDEFEDPAVQALFEDNPWLARAHRKRKPEKAVRVIVRAMEKRRLFAHAPWYTRFARWFPAVVNWVVRTCLIQNPQRALDILRERYTVGQAESA